MPLRSIIALAIVAILSALIIGAIALLAWSRLQSATVRVTLIGVIVVLTAIALWIVFILPAYWDRVEDLADSTWRFFKRCSRLRRSG